ncbi:MAG: hypothetical protein CM1200mP28_10210 [Deltaproteobacteria bacterium]|nr:MAG: hypothetical protein CM1200mP28_10210 [Deltaproteobacteria bacterium]
MERNDSGPSRTEPCKHWEIYRARVTASGRRWSEVNFQGGYYTKGANGFLYFIAPFFGLIAAVATFAIIPIAGPIGDFTFQVTDVNPGLLFIFAITSLNVYGAVLAGTSSNSKFALLGEHGPLHK